MARRWAEPLRPRARPKKKRKENIKYMHPLRFAEPIRNPHALNTRYLDLTVHAREERLHQIHPL